MTVMRSRRLILALLGVSLLAAPALSPVAANGWTGKIVLQSNRDGKTRMWVLTPDGSATQIPNQRGGGKSAGPTWDPTGTQVLFYFGTANDHDLYVINEDGTGLTNLTNSPDVDDRGPSWLPDGSGIVWATTLQGGGMPKIHAMDLVNRVPIRCDNGIPGRNTRPVVSFQGTMVAYNSNELLGGSKDKAMVADFAVDFATNTCSMANRRSVFPKGREWRPNWHPSGTGIISAHTENGDPCVLGKEVYKINLDGTGKTRLTCEPGQDYAPMYSRDGSQIVFTSERDVNQELYIMNQDGSNPVNITNNAANDSQPDWYQAP